MWLAAKIPSNLSLGTLSSPQKGTHSLTEKGTSSSPQKGGPSRPKNGFPPSHSNSRLQSESLEGSFLDLCLYLGPEVFLDRTREHVFIPLASVASYWQLSKVLAAPANPRHPFIKHLEELAKFFDPNTTKFVMAPSPSIAAWGLKYAPSRHTLNVLSNIDLQGLFQKAPMEDVECIFADQLSKNSSLKTAWFQMIEAMEEVGVRSILQLKGIFQDMDARKSFYTRFPELAPMIHRRLILSAQDFSLQSYTPAPVMEHSFHPALEEALSSDSSQDLLLRIESLLRSWQLRLESRKSIFRKIEITLTIPQVVSQRSGRTYTTLYHHPIQIEFPRGLRDAAKIFELVREKFQTFSKNENDLFDQVIESVRIQAKNIERLDEKQLSLFEHEAEDNFEKWKLLLARIQMRSKEGREVQVGVFEAADSYWPEESFEWKEWTGDNVMHISSATSFSSPSSLRESHFPPGSAEDSSLKRKERYLFQPPRPMLFLEEPEHLSVKADKLEDYIDFLKDHNALSSLESLASPINFLWGQHNQVRYYARIEDQWVYWDACSKRIYLHGYFEAI